VARRPAVETDPGLRASVELQIRSGVGATKVRLLGRQLAPREDLDHEVLVLGFEIGDTYDHAGPVNVHGNPAIDATHARIPVVVDTPPQRLSDPLDTRRV
jgi:hypothetical protein